MTGFLRTLSGLLMFIATSEEDIMELNESGWYKTPRVMKGRPFLRHITETRNCGNCMIVDFGRTIDVVDWRYIEADEESPDPICFLGSEVGENVFVSDITEWEFVQYRPNTAWKAIRMDKSNTEGINIYTFERTYKEEIRVNLKPVLIQYRNTFWYIMNIVPMFVKDGMVWDIFLKDRKYDSMVKVTVDDRQTFGYSALSKTYYFEASVPEVKQYTELEDIKQQLKQDGVFEVIVAGVPMKLVRVQEVAKGVLFFVFQDKDKEKRYYHANKGTKLRVITDVKEDTVEYCLDHIKAMHID